MIYTRITEAAALGSNLPVRDIARRGSGAPQPAPTVAFSRAPAVNSTTALARDVLLVAQQAREGSQPLMTRAAERRQGHAAYTRSAANPAPQADAQASQPTGAQVISLFNNTALTSSPAPSAAHQGNPQAQGNEAFSRANRAYVHAGGADGRTFATSGLAGTGPAGGSVNLVI